MSKFDGGPAFSWSPTFQHPNGDTHWTDSDNYGGMSLRDWFAGQALQAVLAKMDTKKVVNASDDDTAQAFMAFAGFAYAIADAMLKVQEAK